MKGHPFFTTVFLYCASIQQREDSDVGCEWLAASSGAASGPHVSGSTARCSAFS
jgi:hypothetical protein